MCSFYLRRKSTYHEQKAFARQMRPSPPKAQTSQRQMVEHSETIESRGKRRQTHRSGRRPGTPSRQDRTPVRGTPAQDRGGVTLRPARRCRTPSHQNRTPISLTPAQGRGGQRTVPGEDPEPRAVKTVLQFAGPWLKAGAGNTRKSKLAEVRV